jgi:DNA-directed RNA polymerase beta' subunit
MEMNLHMPQDPESESELRNLAAIPYQIISPANNSPIIGIFQDSMLGSYQFTRKDVSFTPKDAMRLLMQFKRTDASIFKKQKGERITNFEILSQILAPLTLKLNNGQYDKEKGDEKEKSKSSNNVVEIINGQYLRGQLDKGILGSGTKGIIHRICNDFGNMSSASFIDDLQNIVTEYMKHSSFSVGISDLITDKATNDKIVSLITDKKTEVKNLIHQVQIGIFENTSGKTNEEEFETKVNNILGSIQKDAGRTAIDNLSKTNRFLTMFNAGSKGSEINIQQMTACLGQQNVDGKRIPYGFEHRTLPHFTKFDDGPAARGFVENSYIGGMSPQEVYFHAMGGRIGLIDTAVKTSTTGYIQRRLIKSLEDAMVNYDMTVRNSKNKIIQFAFGEDSIDTVKVENQIFPVVEMTVQEIYSHFMLMEDENKTKKLSNIFTSNAYKLHKNQNTSSSTLMEKSLKYANEIVDSRKILISNVFNNKSDKLVRAPVAFAHLIKNIAGQQYINSNSLVDLTMLEAFEMIENGFDKLEKIYFAKPTQLFRMLYFYYLSPKDLLINKRFNRKSLELLIETVILTYKRSIVSPGEMVGIVAAQSIGEPTTQMSQIFCEHIWCQKINKNTNKISSVIIKIGELCDKIIEENPHLTFNTGHEDSVETLLDGLEDEYYIIGVDGEEKTHWNKISHISRHPVNGGLVKVTTRSGREVTTTLSHSHLIRNNNTVEPIRGDQLTIGMRIPVTKYVDNDFIETHIKIGDMSIELNNLFGWFIGAYLAEGNVSKYVICITNVAENYINNTSTVAKMFGKTPNVQNRRGEYGPSTATSFSCKEFANFLIETCGTGSFVKRVPDFAFTAPLEFKEGLIQGYMDGDGNFQSDDRHHQIRACSRSERLIKDLALIFNYFGIFTSIKVQNHKNMPLYHLYISPKYSRIYKENIGSVLHSEKLDELIEYSERDDAHNLSDEIDKINGLGEIIATCGKVLKLPGQSRTYGRWKNKSSIGRRTLKKYIEIFEANENSHLIENELKILNQAEKSDVIWDEIVKLEIREPAEDEKYVYDFTVPRNQTFMNHSGIIVHNTLNTFHFSGVASKSNVTRGVPRIEELLSLHHPIKNPSLTIYLKPDDENDKQKASVVQYMIEYTKLGEIVKSIGICFDPDDMNTLIQEDKEMMSQFNEFEQMVTECNGEKIQVVGSEKQMEEKGSKTNKSKWIIRMEMDAEVMLEKNITMDDVNFALVNSYGSEIDCVYSDYNSEKLVFRIRMNDVILENKKPKVNPLDQSDQIYILKNFQEQILTSIVLRGIKNIKKVILRKVKDNLIEKAGGFVKNDIWILDTIGTNLLDVLGLDYINVNKTISNDVIEVLDVLGIEAARKSLYNEMSEVLEFDGAYVNTHHMSLLCDRMTHSHRMISVFRHGINSDDIGPIAKASFEETPEMFLKAARHAELDTVRGISANIMCGQEGLYGTSSFQLVLDLNEFGKLEEQYKYEYVNVNKMIDNELMKNIDDITECSVQKLTINTNITNLKEVEMAHDDEYNPFE